MSIQQRLSNLKVNLPAAAAPAANYVPYRFSGAQLFISGQLPFDETGTLTGIGRLGAELATEDGVALARLCAINILAQVNTALNGDLERIAGLIKLTGFVASTPDFTEQPLVINGASDFFADVLGERGRHARAAVGVAVLPFGVGVEIEAIFEVAAP